MSRKFFVDALRPIFNAVDGVDFGQGTLRQIRYDIADWKTITRRFLTDFLDTTWIGPWSADLELNDGTTTLTGTINSNFDRTAYNISSGGPLNNIASSTFVPDYPGCPLVEEGGTVFEDATISNIYNGNATVLYDFFTPAIEQDSWDNATHVWLKFDVAVISSITHPYICQPSEFQGSVPDDPLPTNYLGIAEAGDPDTLFPSATDSIALGDGTMHAFFDNSIVAPYFKITALNTNSF